MRKITFLITMLLVAALSFGQTPMSGTYKVGTGETAPNFALLSEAVTALNTNGLSGDVVLEIATDINETVNIGLINESAFTITIRPDKDEPRVITFDKATDNAGPSGAFCFGIGMGLAWTDLKPSKNMVIDGYAVGGSTRQLKIATAVTHHGGNGPILLMDDCSNVQIKNTIIHHEGATSSASNYGIYLRVNTSYGTKKMPSNVLIENNDITNIKNGASQGIALYANAAPEGGVSEGVVIKNNIIKARTRGIFLNQLNGIDIIGNEFHVVQTNASTLSSGIMANAGIAGTINVKSNNFAELKTYNSTAGDWGMKGIIAGGGTWYIENNFFCGLDKPYGDGNSMLQAIRLGGTTATYIRHNTFFLKSLTKKPVNNIENPSSADPSYCAINIAAGNPEIKNNIFISEETEVFNYFIRGGIGGESDYNNFYFDALNTKSRINAASTTLADYQSGTGKDANSTFVAVQFENTATGDLRIAGTSQQDINLSAPLIAEVATDILGATRENPTYKGAHQGTLPFVATSVDQAGEQSFSVRRTPAGVSIIFEGQADVEIYGVNGQLIEKTRAYNNYDRDLHSGIYIIRVNGNSQKFVR